MPQGNEFIEGPGKDAAAEEIREFEELRCSAIQREGWDWLGFVGSTTEAKYSPQSFVHFMHSWMLYINRLNPRVVERTIVAS